MRDVLRVQQPLDALITRDERAGENSQHDCDTGQILDPAIAESEALARLLAGQPECNGKRDRGRGIAEIVDGIREQRDTAGHEHDGELKHCRGSEADERPLDRPQAPVAGRDRRIDDAVRMGMSMRMCVAGRMLMRMTTAAHAQLARLDFLDSVSRWLHRGRQTIQWTGILTCQRGGLAGSKLLDSLSENLGGRVQEQTRHDGGDQQVRPLATMASFSTRRRIWRRRPCYTITLRARSASPPAKQGRGHISFSPPS